MGTLVRAAVLTNYFEVAQHLGLNPQPLLRMAGLTRKLLAEPEQRIPLAAVLRLLEASARESGCDTFGLRMAESRQLADFGAVSLLLTHQRTLRDALQTTIRYRHLLNESLAIHIDEVGGTVVLREDVVADVPVVTRQGTELAIGVLFRLCGALLGANWHPQSVNFTHDPPRDLQLHRRMFRCRLHFGAEFNGIVCPAADLDYPNPVADPTLARHAARFVESLAGTQASSLLLDTRKAIFVGLPMGGATIDQVALSMGMNVRTLQRRLEDDGAVFSDLVNDVRRQLVLRYLENPQFAVSRVAGLLGYSRPSSFTRWFTSEYGRSPNAWRAEHAKPAASDQPRGS